MTAPSKKTNSHLFRNRFLIVLLFILGATIVLGFMSFQNIYLKIFNFGKPDILRIILVLFFKKIVKKIGSTVIR